MGTDETLRNTSAAHRVGAVVVAAGLSTRMGTSKALLPWGDRPMIGHVIATLAATGGIEPVVVVTGYQADQIRAAVAGLGVQCVHNPEYAEGGMLSSVCRGMAAMADDVDGIMLVLGDQPAVRTATLAQLVSVWRQSRAPLAIPTYQGQRGHPVIFAVSLLPEIQSLQPPQTLRDVVHRHLDRASMVPVDDAGVIGDVDTPEEYRRALAQWEHERERA